MVYGQVEGVLLDEEVLVQGLPVFKAVVQRADIATGTKGLFTRTAQNHRMHLWVMGPGIELLVQAADHVQGEGVEAGGAVKGQVPDMVAHVGQHFVFNDWSALRVELRDYVYSGNRALNGQLQSHIESQFMLDVGISFFFPIHPSES